MDRRGHAVARRLAHGLAALRQRLPEPAYTLARTREIYETYYDVKYPGHEREAGRPLRLSPAYARLRELGAAFGEKSGWERANWFEPNAARGDESLRPRGWAGKLWSPAIGAEHRACRETAALFDETSFAKLEVRARAPPTSSSGCVRTASRVSVGRVTYTQMLNARGGVECDFTVSRLADDRFRIVTGTAFGQHDLAWLRAARARRRLLHRRRRHLGATPASACGGRARGRSSSRSRRRPGERGVPVHERAELAVGTVPCLALRVTYVGELGWELYCPAEYGLALWDTLWERGPRARAVAGGYRAIDSLRLEKGYRVWGADVTPDDTPYEAGLGFAVKLDKGDFLGREALDGPASPRAGCAA